MAGEAGRHDVDQVAVAPFERMRIGRTAEHARIAPRIERAADHRDAHGRPGAAAGAQRECAERRKRRLTDRDDMQRPCVRKQRAEKAVEHPHIVVETEVARSERHVARVQPVGNVHVAVLQQCCDCLAHHHGRVAGQRHAEQNRAGRGRAIGAREAAQRAERRRTGHDRFGDRVPPAVEHKRLECERRWRRCGVEYRGEQIVEIRRCRTRQRRGRPRA